jgi:hypothetical protein
MPENCLLAAATSPRFYGGAPLTGWLKYGNLPYIDQLDSWEARTDARYQIRSSAALAGSSSAAKDRLALELSSKSKGRSTKEGGGAPGSR